MSHLISTSSIQVKDGRIPAESVVDIDALILLAAKFDKESIPASERF